MHTECRLTLHLLNHPGATRQAVQPLLCRTSLAAQALVHGVQAHAAANPFPAGTISQAVQPAVHDLTDNSVARSWLNNPLSGSLATDIYKATNIVRSFAQASRPSLCSPSSQMLTCLGRHWPLVTCPARPQRAASLQCSWRMYLTCTTSHIPSPAAGSGCSMQDRYADVLLGELACLGVCPGLAGWCCRAVLCCIYASSHALWCQAESRGADQRDLCSMGLPVVTAVPEQAEALCSELEVVSAGGPPSAREGHTSSSPSRGCRICHSVCAQGEHVQGCCLTSEE